MTNHTPPDGGPGPMESSPGTGRRRFLALSGLTAAGAVLGQTAAAAPAAGRGAGMSAGISQLTISGLLSDLRSRRTTCVEVVTSVLERIAAYDQAGPALNALITVNPDALDRAAELDGEFRRTGRLRAAHGVPVVVKDNIDTTDLVTTGGSELFAGFRPAADAALVDRLLAAGAILIGKANLDDFAAAVYGVSSIAGAMPNPYGADFTVGGSSGGCGSAVSAGYVPLAIGTDAGGSLRIPAAFTSTVTIRPTIGLVSRRGIMPRGLTQDTAGPMARTVADAATGLDLIAGYDPGDAVTARGMGHIPEHGYASFAEPRSLRGKRLGVIRRGLALFGRDEPDIVGLLEAAVTDLRTLRATVVELAPPGGSVLGAGSTITLESARDVNAYLAAQQGGAPVSSFRELYDSGSYTSYAKEAFDREITVDPDTLDDNLSYQKTLSARTRLQDWVYSQLAEHDLDAIVYASAMRFPAALTVEQGGVFTRLSENTGFPALSVPMGYGGPSALPAGLEILGRPFTEPLLISVAAAYEEATRHRTAPDLD